MTTTSAASYITADTHAGTWTRKGIPAGHRADNFTAAELAEMFGQEFVIWESAGQSRDGRELFVRSRNVPQTDCSLAGYDADGRLIILHPANRALRVLTRIA